MADQPASEPAIGDGDFVYPVEDGAINLSSKKPKIDRPGEVVFPSQQEVVSPSPQFLLRLSPSPRSEFQEEVVKASEAGEKTELMALFQRAVVSLSALTGASSSTVTQQPLEPPPELSSSEKPQNLDDIKALVQRSPESRLYWCHICSHKTKDHCDIVRHLCRHYEVKPCECKVCGFRAVTNMEISSHAAIHSRKRPYQCSMCPYAAKRKSDLMDHLQKKEHIVTQMPSLSEQASASSLSSKDDLEPAQESSGVQETVIDPPYEPPPSSNPDLKVEPSGDETAPGEDEPSSEQSVATDAMSEKGAICSKQGSSNRASSSSSPFSSSSTTSSSRVEGTSQHAEPPPMKEEPMTVSNSSSEMSLDEIKAMVRRSPVSRLYSCHVCQHRSKDHCDIVRHLCRHYDVKPYKCDYCPFRAVTNMEISSHIAIHSRKRPFQCSMCSYAAKRKSDLLDHMQKKEHK